MNETGDVSFVGGTSNTDELKIFGWVVVVRY